jgi:hypothetical protein
MNTFIAFHPSSSTRMKELADQDARSHAALVHHRRRRRLEDRQRILQSTLHKKSSTQYFVAHDQHRGTHARKVMGHSGDTEASDTSTAPGTDLDCEKLVFSESSWICPGPSLHNTQRELNAKVFRTMIGARCESCQVVPPARTHIVA